MKTGRTLMELAQEVQRQAETKKDFIGDTANMEMESGDLRLIQSDNTIEFRPTDNCHQQIANRVGIPMPYYDKMRESAPQLLDINVNHWFKNNTETRMVRTLDGNARAFLSDRYRPLDNSDLLEAALPIISENGADVLSCEVTENRMYVKALLPKIEAEVTKGDIVQAGLVISNSEVGRGSLRVEPLIYRLVCLNGMITSSSMKKYHVGRGNGDYDAIEELLTDATKQKTDEAFWMQVRDIIKGSFTEDIFLGNVNKLRESLDNQITKDPIKVVEIVRKKYQLSDGNKTSVLQHLISGGGLTQYHLAQAITRTANDETDYDRATELERLGGKIIELPKRDWEALAA